MILCALSKGIHLGIGIRKRDQIAKPKTKLTIIAPSAVSPRIFETSSGSIETPSNDFLKIEKRDTHRILSGHESSGNC